MQVVLHLLNLMHLQNTQEIDAAFSRIFTANTFLLLQLPLLLSQKKVANKKSPALSGRAAIQIPLIFVC